MKKYILKKIETIKEDLDKLGITEDRKVMHRKLVNHKIN